MLIFLIEFYCLKIRNGMMGILIIKLVNREKIFKKYSMEVASYSEKCFGGGRWG